MKLLDKIPLLPLGIIAVVLLLAPFSPEPHLWQKAKMLIDGTLTKPLDIFDVIWHAGPLLLFIYIGLRRRR